MNENTKEKITKKPYWIALIIIAVIVAVIAGTRNNGQTQQETPTYADESNASQTAQDNDVQSSETVSEKMFITEIEKVLNTVEMEIEELC